MTKHSSNQNRLSNCINRIQPSATIAVSAKAAELRSQGKDIINLSVGEPDFDTPDFIKEAAIKAIQMGQTKYTPVNGIPELIKSIQNKFKRDQGIDYNSNQLLVSTGAKHSLFNCFLSVLNPNDEVLIPTPAWVSYTDMAKLCDAKPIEIQTTAENGFKLTSEQLEKHITPKTKLIIFNSPTNPTGMAYSKKQWLSLAKILKNHPNILILCDDIYEYIHWDSNGNPSRSESFSESVIKDFPELKNQFILINGVSKAFAMTGWRIGFSAGPIDIIQAMKKLQSQNTSCACSIAQAASVAALNQNPDFLKPMVKIFKQRHDLTLSLIQNIPGFTCEPAQGAFYLFPDISEAMKKLNCESDIEFATLLIEKANVAAVPGSAFGTPGHVRFSYATSEKQIKIAFERIHNFLVSASKT